MNGRTLAKYVLRPVLKRPLLLRNRVLVGTRHKTGTVWFTSVFRSLSGQLGLDFVYADGAHPDPGRLWDVFVSGHSRFGGLNSPNFRGVHVIRDPRDLIVSATHYHQTSDELWLHEKCSDFGGMTYQEKICSYASFDERMLFEMENASFRAIGEMVQFEDGADDRFLTVKYSEMIGDHSLDLFEAMFQFLGFRGPAMGWCLVSAYRNSLFSGAVSSDHVRSGKPAQWPEYFKPIHEKRFEELFGDALVRLGYER
jgi:hypothetical protein